MLSPYYLKDGVLYEGEDLDCSPILILSDPTDLETQNLSDRYGVPISRIQAVSDLDEPSSFDTDGSFYYSIFDVPYKSDDGHYDTIPVSTIFGKNLFIVVCKRRIQLFYDYFYRCGRDRTPDTVTLVARMYQVIIREYQNNLRALNRQLKEIKSKAHDRTSEEDLFLLDDIGNSLVSYLMSLRGMRSVLSKVPGNVLLDKSSPVRTLLKSLINDNNQSIEMALTYQSVCENAEVLVQTNINLRLNKTMRFLALVTIVLTIPMIITGFYGMNVDLPFQGQHLAYIVVILICAVLCFIAVWLYRIGMRR